MQLKMIQITKRFQSLLVASKPCFSTYHNRPKNVNRKINQKKQRRDNLIERFSHKIIDGQVISNEIKSQLKQKIIDLNELREAKIHDKPILGYIQVGNITESNLYVKLKLKAADTIGIEHRGILLPEDTSEQDLIIELNKFQSDPMISGIMVQLPLPEHINQEKILNLIQPQKDVDGLHPYNIGSLALKHHHPYYVSCTPLAVQELILRQLDKNDLEAKTVCIVGRSNIVGMPLSLLLRKQNCDVLTVHSRTPLEQIRNTVQRSDILVACCGDPEFIKASWIKPEAIVIDVGITYQEDREDPTKSMILGDCQFNEEMLKKVSKITRVPGGVGPMTITMLMNNLTNGWMRDNFTLRQNESIYTSL